jgi:hypothetical protein
MFFRCSFDVLSMLQVPPLLPHLLPHTQTVVELVLLGEVKAQASGLAKKQAGGYVAEMMNNAKKGKVAGEGGK